MNKNIINTLFVGAATLALASCGENTWNKEFLDGFEGGVDYENSVSGSYTLTADDYKAISDLMADLATTDAEKAEAKAIATNCYFNKFGAFPASVALPPFMETAAFPYYLGSNGSQAEVSYAEAAEVPAELSAIAGATEYTVSTDDYKNAWGSDVDYIAAFAPMTSAENKLPGILKTALPDAAEGSYAIVRYNESASNPVFITSTDETPVFDAGTYYIVADGSKAATPQSKAYGYLYPADVTPADGVVETAVENGFTFEPTAGGFYLKDGNGKYLYLDDSHNSFQMSESVPESAGVWTVELAANGSATITNVEREKWIQYSTQYSSYGAYNTESGVLPMLYHALPINGNYFLVTDENQVATPVAADKTYGYLYASEDASVKDGVVVSDAANAFTFEVAEGGYHIKDTYGRYLYVSGTFNSFNVTTDLPESGAVWSASVDKDGFYTITNTVVGKYMQFTSYGSFGIYDYENGTLPKLFAAAATAAPANRPMKVVAGTPVSAGVNAVYYFDGSNWSVADGVSALDPADYTAMGVDNAKLTSPETFIPIYLKNKLIYAQAGDQQFVVYNYNKVDLFVFDGANWTLNNNGLENVVGRYTKSNGSWSFTKYIGKATFTAFNDSQIMLDRSYLLVYGSVCASPIDKGSSYGYLPVASVTVSGESIVLPSDANAFTFASSVNVDGTEYKAPDGKFFIYDSNGRYYYYDGSHASSNVSDKVTITDGAIGAGFLWSAKNNGDGSWTIENDRGSDNIRWLVYSSSYNNCALYNNITENDHYFSLFIMD